MIDEAKTRRLYDRIADVHNVALKVNRYRHSVTKYLRSLNLDLGPDPLVLDAGSGTGIQTLGLASAGLNLKRAIALDISPKSLHVAREQFRKDRVLEARKIDVIQGDILEFPFGDNTFDLALTCGALEYVPLDKGLEEIARVLKPGGKLVLIPVKPSVVGTVLEVLYKFKTHKVDDVKRIALRHFNIVGNHTFPPIEPMGWSKRIFLLEKKIKP
ncbi:MAG: class I SAM-dependent methyltransferase [Pyrinomonadaceae bacterium]|nr:class I SAM-dependent methyltransferase [Pyrinomonadaceae bacterium]